MDRINGNNQPPPNVGAGGGAQDRPPEQEDITVINPRGLQQNSIRRDESIARNMMSRLFSEGSSKSNTAGQYSAQGFQEIPLHGLGNSEENKTNSRPLPQRTMSRLFLSLNTVESESSKPRSVPQIQEKFRKVLVAFASAAIKTANATKGFQGTDSAIQASKDATKKYTSMKEALKHSADAMDQPSRTHAESLLQRVKKINNTIFKTLETLRKGSAVTPQKPSAILNELRDIKNSIYELKPASTKQKTSRNSVDIYSSTVPTRATMSSDDPNSERKPSAHTAQNAATLPPRFPSTFNNYNASDRAVVDDYDNGDSSSESSQADQARQVDDESVWEDAGSLLYEGGNKDAVEYKPSEAQEAFLKSDQEWHNPPADGNCLFHCLSKFLEKGNTNDVSQSDIRAQVAGEAALLSTEGDSPISFKDAQAIAKDGHYTNDGAASACDLAARVLNMNIDVVNNDGSVTSMHVNHPDGHITLALNNEHFMLLQPKGS